MDVGLSKKKTPSKDFVLRKLTRLPIRQDSKFAKRMLKYVHRRKALETLRFVPKTRITSQLSSLALSIPQTTEIRMLLSIRNKELDHKETLVFDCFE